eukprot:NODE_3553_length_946_cov_29.981685_g3401_i0.p1 GENE.NODE_3553_length_946_cov_29.981685_g3401_i0~~NODE_3553_length_946_cov_29.981685_g3401_i0.p1  ORF type:complete len:238 (-),score=45.88 NODE_3553_length_946_cov_29.981685_g3401_i0:43-756(-)
MACWNGAAKLTSHATHALDAALEIQTLSKQPSYRNAFGPFELRVHLATTTDTAFVGNIGTTTKQFVCFGVSISRLKQLCVLAKTLNLPIVAAGDLRQYELQYTLRGVDVVQYKGRTDQVFELVGHKVMATDEWMYQLNTGRDATLEVFNNGFRHYQQQSFCEASNALAEYLIHCPHDNVAIRLLVLCRNFCVDPTLSLSNGHLPRNVREISTSVPILELELNAMSPMPLQEVETLDI